MSNLHLRSASTTLFERLHRTISIFSDAVPPVAQRASRALSDRFAAVRHTFRQHRSHIRRG